MFSGPGVQRPDMEAHMRLEDIVKAEVLPSDTKLLVSIIKQLASEVISLRSAINKCPSCNPREREND